MISLTLDLIPSHPTTASASAVVPSAKRITTLRPSAASISFGLFPDLINPLGTNPTTVSSQVARCTAPCPFPSVAYTVKAGWAPLGGTLSAVTHHDGSMFTRATPDLSSYWTGSSTAG